MRKAHALSIVLETAVVRHGEQAAASKPHGDCDGRVRPAYAHPYAHSGDRCEGRLVWMTQARRLTAGYAILFIAVALILVGRKVAGRGRPTP